MKNHFLDNVSAVKESSPGPPLVSFLLLGDLYVPQLSFPWQPHNVTSQKLGRCDATLFYTHTWTTWSCSLSSVAPNKMDRKILFFFFLWYIILFCLCCPIKTACCITNSLAACLFNQVFNNLSSHRFMISFSSGCVHHTVFITGFPNNTWCVGKDKTLKRLRGEWWYKIMSWLNIKWVEVRGQITARIHQSLNRRIINKSERLMITCHILYDFHGNSYISSTLPAWIYDPYRNCMYCIWQQGPSHLQSSLWTHHFPSSAS